MKGQATSEYIIDVLNTSKKKNSLQSHISSKITSRSSVYCFREWDLKLRFYLINCLDRLDHHDIEDEDNEKTEYIHTLKEKLKAVTARIHHWEDKYQR